MKKITILLLTIWVLISMSSVVFAELVTVPVGPSTNAYDAASRPPFPLKAKKELSSVETLARIIAKSQKADREQRKNISTNLDALKKSNEVIAEGVIKTSTEIQGVGTKVDATEKKVDGISQQISKENNILRSRSSDIFLVLVVLIVAAVILMALANGVTARRTRLHVTNTVEPITDNVNRYVARAEVIATENRTGFNDVLTAVTALSAKVDDRADRIEQKVDSINTFDAKPLDAKTKGHHVIFNQSADATAREEYQMLEVELGDPATTAKDYELHSTKSRNEAHDNLRKVTRQYHDGSLQKRAAAGDVSAKLTIEVFEYMRDVTKQLTVTKL